MTLYINTNDQKIVEVALKTGSKVTDKVSGENRYGSEILLPLIKQLLENNNLQFGNLTGIEVKIGPGSFIGLRVGASVAQALGYALHIPVNGKVGKNVRISYT